MQKAAMRASTEVQEHTSIDTNDTLTSERAIFQSEWLGIESKDYSMTDKQIIDNKCLFQGLAHPRKNSFHLHLLVAVKTQVPYIHDDTQGGQHFPRGILVLITFGCSLLMSLGTIFLSNIADNLPVCYMNKPEFKLV